MNWKEILKNSNQYRPIPFWSWNAKLELPRLKEQIREMKKAGFGGFFMHARSGLKTEYMSQEWFDCIETCIAEADEIGMDAWCYDENGWPSGFAGMKLLEDVENLAHYITFEEVRYYPTDALAVYIIKENGELERIYRESKEPMYAIYDHTNASVVDILNEQVVQKFIKLSHEEYYQRLPKELFKKMRGFFTDEPQYFRHDTPYSPVLQSLYREKYGEELLDGLAALFVDCTDCYQFRWRYWKMLNDQFVQSFAKQVYEWCEEHNCQLTGHGIEERYLSSQMWCCAGVMPFYEYEHVPGCDWLGRAIDTEITPKQVSSVAQQLGKKQVLTESFACTGWDVTPRELKKVLDWQYVNGVNTLCIHLLPYSIEGNRKYDHPAFFGQCNPWFSCFAEFSKYIYNLGCLLGESEEYAPVGVIHPMHSAYLTYNRKDDYKSIERLEDEFRQLVELLGSSHIPHHYIDETLLAKHGSVKENVLQLGLCRYQYIVVPSMQQLDSTTVELLKEYQANGGKIYLAGDVPTYASGKKEDLSFLQSTVTWEEMVPDKFSVNNQKTSVRATYRSSQSGDFMFVTNLGDSTETVKYTIAAQGAALLDLIQEKELPLPYVKQSEDKIILELTLQSGESAVLLLGDYEPQQVKEYAHNREIEWKERCIEHIDDNALVLDRACWSLDGKAYSSELPIEGIAELLLSACKNKTVYLRYGFQVERLPLQVSLRMERMNAAELQVNGNHIQLTEEKLLDSDFLRGDISTFLQEGSNEIVVKLDYFQNEHVYDVLYRTPDVTESLINCLTYDTELAPLYLLGEFCVRGKRELLPEESMICYQGPFTLTSPKLPPIENLTENGYPFFAGHVVVRGKVKATVGYDVKLKLKGRFGTAKIRWNDYKGALVTEETIIIPAAYVEETNKVEIEIYSGNRNTQGPFHFKGLREELAQISPPHFTLVGSWKEGGSSLYQESYKFVPFGVRLIGTQDLYEL